MAKNKQTRSYNLSSFPDFQFGHVLPPKITSTKVKNSELRECLLAAIFLASQIELAQGSINLRAEPIQSAYFRATLAELIRVEDITEKQGRKLKFHMTDDPLLHSIKLLRNYQVHISGIRLSAGSTEVIWAGEKVIYESFVADNLDAKELRKLCSAKDYTDDQLAELVSLFDQHQRRLGIVQLLYNTCIHVGELLENI